jgi:protein-tyrosine-phosphatase
MAAGYLAALGGGRVEVHSAGSGPADRVNPAVVEVMRERSVDISGERPKLLQDANVREADVVVTMGCGDACPVYPGKRYEDWAVDDPAGRDIETVRRIRDDIEGRVKALLASLGLA